MRNMSNRMRSQSAKVTVLKALIPYSRENLMLSFRPNQFFNELDRSSAYNKHTLETAMWRAGREGLIKREGKLVKLTAKGLKLMQPYMAAKLGKNARLMVSFDIPEDRADLRRRLRLLLREWHFKQIQKSVWVSEYNYGDSLVKAIKEMAAEDYVQIFECVRLFPKS